MRDLGFEERLAFDACGNNRLHRKISNVNKTYKFVLKAFQCSINIHLGVIDARVLLLILTAFMNAEYGVPR